MMSTQEMNHAMNEQINHKNFITSMEYYRGTNDGGIGDRTVSSTNENNNDSHNRIKVSQQNVSIKYDESALSRCALLFIGALCQQGEYATIEQFLFRHTHTHTHTLFQSFYKFNVAFIGI